MINFDSSTLKLWLLENAEFLTGARIQKIQQPTRRDLILSLRNKSQTKKLYVNIDPQFYHISFMSKETEEKRGLEIPAKPPMFCMLLRKYLENALISKVNQPEFERIVEFYIETYNELSEKIYLCLAVELMGKYSNIVLYNFDTNVILGCAHNVGEEKSREREMAGGLPYTYPSNRPSVWHKAGFETPDINYKIDEYYAGIIFENRFKKLQNTIIQTVNGRLKKNKNTLLKIEKQGLTKEKADKYRLFGDLITANLYNNKDYTKSITVFDYENNRELTIELDETKTLKENASRYFKLYNKGKTAYSKFLELSDTIKAENDYLQQVLYSAEIAEGTDELKEIMNELEPQKVVKTKEKASIVPDESEIEGFKVYVGRNNRQNDYIVSKLSKDEDYWFHTKDCAGSHVLLKCSNPSDRIIYECAKLAKEYSKGKDSSKVSVIYTKRKHLKKPPKANLGYVTYTNEQEIIIGI